MSLDATLDALRADTAGQGRIALGLSGGKDSLACLELLRMIDVRPVLVWIDTGAGLPHMRERIERAASGYELIHVQTDQKRQWREMGVASPVVAMKFHVAGAVSSPDDAGRPRQQAWQDCHVNLVSRPFWEAVARSGATRLVNGQRRGEVTPLKPSPLSWCPAIYPLWDWTDEDVFAFLRARNVELPEQYAAGVNDDMQCPTCPAFATAESYRYLQRAYPETAAELRAILATLDSDVREEYDRTIGRVMGEVMTLKPFGAAAC